MGNRVHGIYYRLAFAGIGTFVLLALFVLILVLNTITGVNVGGLIFSLLPLVIAGLLFLIFLGAFQDIRQGLTIDAGTVNRKGEYFIGVTCEMPVTSESFEDNQELQALKDDQGLEVAQEMSEFYSPTDREFKVSREIYDWLSPSDKVIVTYWPRTSILTWVDKTGPGLK